MPASSTSRHLKGWTDATAIFNKTGAPLTIEQLPDPQRSDADPVIAASRCEICVELNQIIAARPI